ncbi:NEDD8 ultimate buster 1-like isoform X2 [Mercenaria mercenaria]|uniref:NEDD8 ultimate buster 1-like isoform X2 n=1 Tax=Mercenaria mercenaria TaxID=6596 RepID=UPI00234E54F9|nr:NEDD8 ultimate buster 1-like isoform X2 [Mercenaria mercenaria]
MASDEFYKKQIGAKLNRDKVKLWEPPYTNKDGGAGSIPQELITKYAAEIGISESQVAAVLDTLRTHALQKLAEREKYKSSGLATLKIKISGSQGTKQVMSVEISLTCKGEELRKKVCDSLDDSARHFKMICSGRVIAEDKTLQEQNIRNGSQILALCLKVSETEAQAEDKISAEIQDFRHAAELLSNRAEQEYDEMDIQIADQSGKPIQLPPGEKRALTLAMALHEKGRQALKKKNVTLALPLLLEADKEFKQCRADILNSVDNYAILCLDIVWCYLCLKHVEDLPDAEERLRNSENFFQKSYGSDLQRLMAVKGSSGEELALFMKLHLLQGIVAFHQHRMEEASNLLSKAEQELQRLDIDDDKITTVMAMGFSEGETRLGLRACDGNIQNAVAHIMKRREEKKENARKRREERHKKNLEKHLGKTAGGKHVNVDVYQMLLGMGYPKGASAEALRQANNDLNLALEVLQNHPEFLSLPDPEPKPNVKITDAMIAQVTSMGFEPEMAQRALAKHKGDVPKAIEELVSSGGDIPPPAPGDQSPSTSSGSSDSTTSEDSSSEKTPEQLKEEKEAIDRLVSDLPEDEEDYLDISLDEEKQFLQEYKSLILSLRS